MITMASIVVNDPRTEIKKIVNDTLSLRKDKRGLPEAIRHAARIADQTGQSTDSWDRLGTEVEVATARKFIRQHTEDIIFLLTSPDADFDQDGREALIKALTGENY